ncbi:hypothetical protein AGMMS49928_11280 [Spirochaetia bacterium]|nr:hypothetical protein AGMMS49928_11280 [Spirochaetia bacterium]
MVKPAGKRSTARKSSLWTLFWIGLFILVAGLFFINLDLIRKTIQGTSLENLFGKSSSGDSEPPVVNEPPPPAVEPPPAVRPVAPVNPPEAAPPVPESPEPAVSEPAAVPAPAPAPAGPERPLYFARVDGNGITWIKVARQFDTPNAPLRNTLRALLEGPTAEERRRGLRSLIPPGTRLLSVEIQGNTAFIDFSDDFQYNENGSEGLKAQLRQIVWTVTEFSNIKDVQFLIESRQIDYLSASIWIGGPLNRNSPAIQD